MSPSRFVAAAGAVHDIRRGATLGLPQVSLEPFEPLLSGLHLPLGLLDPLAQGFEVLSRERLGLLCQNQARRQWQHQRRQKALD